MNTEIEKKLTDLGVTIDQLSKSLREEIMGYDELESEYSEIEKQLKDEELPEAKREKLKKRQDKLTDLLPNIFVELEDKIEKWFKNKDKRAAIVKKMQDARKKNIEDRKRGKEQAAVAANTKVEEKKVTEVTQTKEESKQESPNPEEKTKKANNTWGWVALGVVAAAVGLGALFQRRN